MHLLLQQIEQTLLIPCGLSVTAIVEDPESEEYLGYNLVCNGNIRLKFRQAKLTPKKAGNFVAMWKRNALGATEPFEYNDDFDYYLVAVQSGHCNGLFFFTNEVLKKNGVLTHDGKEGKRGFRLYPDWVKAPNRQAEKTQQWQLPYFIRGVEEVSDAVVKLKRMLSV